MTTTTAPIATPTGGIIPTGTDVKVIERIPGRFLIINGVRRTALLSAEQVAAVTVTA